MIVPSRTHYNHPLSTCTRRMLLRCKIWPIERQGIAYNDTVTVLLPCVAQRYEEWTNLRLDSWREWRKAASATGQPEWMSRGMRFNFLQCSQSGRSVLLPSLINPIGRPTGGRAGVDGALSSVEPLSRRRRSKNTTKATKAAATGPPPSARLTPSTKP
jgi:hypothetical protein